jgi:hypothetical protein
MAVCSSPADAVVLTECNSLSRCGIKVVERVAEWLVARCASVRGGDVADPFSSEHKASVSLSFYMVRLARYANIAVGGTTDCDSVGVRAAVLTAIWAVRLEATRPGFKVNEHNVHRIAASAFYLAMKVLEDDASSVPVTFWASVAGVTPKEMHGLEAAFCAMLDFKLTVGGEEFEQYSDVFDQSHL